MTFIGGPEVSPWLAASSNGRGDLGHRAVVGQQSIAFRFHIGGLRVNRAPQAAQPVQQPDLFERPGITGSQFFLVGQHHITPSCAFDHA